MNPIHDYAAIGDCRTAALVSRAGSIDWLCWPRFDSPSIFGAILDDAAGTWRIAPVAPYVAERHYIDGTNVLQTRFTTEHGSVVLTDLMPVASEEAKHRLLVPEHELLRVIECDRGDVELEMVFEPRPDFGRGRVHMRQAGALGLRVETRDGLLVLRTDMPIEVRNGATAQGRVRLREGETIHASLTFASQWQAVLPPLGVQSTQAIARSVEWWRAWLTQLTYAGPARAAVERSALALKLLVYAPSGAIVAAATTSLPERVGGDHNWDYRFCWLRDASFTVRALFGLGFRDEATAFVSWLLHSTRLTQPELRILYDVDGNEPEPEHELSHLDGHLGSKPVRVGNAATDQLQLDVYGEVVEAVAQFVRHGGTLDRETQRMLCAFGEYVCRNWQRPDEGIWEPRSGKGHNTHSRLLCWVALDRLLALHADGHLRGAPVGRFAESREAIRHEIETRAWNDTIQSYAARLDGDRVDATLLLLPWYGFADASSERMRLTYRRIRERLGVGNGLLYRYVTEDSPGEGAFGICSFWGAEYLALGGGTAEEARQLFEVLCGYATDVGLFAEEIDPATGCALGNTPQAFTHVGLINAALSLADRLEAQPGRVPLRPHEAVRSEMQP